MRKAMVFGAGVSGKGSEKTLKEMGYEVFLIDDKTDISSEEGLKILENEKIDIFIKSPGVPYTNLVKKALELKIEVIDDIELGYRYKINNNIKGKIIAITGTNGKTTVTSKINEMLEKAGYTSKVCGNIGYSFSETIMENPSLDYYVLEASSYQLENIKDFKADISLIVNLTPDHLSRYKTLDHYYDTKFNIGRNQKENEYFIVNTSCAESLKRVEKISGKKIFIGMNKTNKNELCFVKEGDIYYERELVLNENLASLKGKHNLENMLFIVTVGKLLGISTNLIREFLYSTKTLEHRMEKFFNYGKVEFINDSKGTNIDSTKFAVEAFKNPILICGGYDKELDLSPLEKLIKNNVKEVYLIGDIANKLEEGLAKINYPKNKVFNLKTLDKVLEELKLKIDKDQEEIILFSPATSSFDQFKNFEERGKVFKELVIRYFN
ncbi:UDP-N-acetylmuramoyl-L-alanine--D-glutamate ligase [Cetobacterium somerae]|uniref:UDP-N-acetylmuramoyl-L-alanine--D-glutamate ligase n=1 Tax=Cetobacterium sp. NK01 TaxID=2993530 RepID=UPI0021171FF2|nr:UDP-N-acetylmuramoyl-L-alanine--D-glutamate ligase [Cetobacterium sp. NK01]MCQ8212324.1 UDP-N-acetylmuramoyl-L-alanine--D-glutamate ligase [Cetobacterium sp. NK01]